MEKKKLDNEINLQGIGIIADRKTIKEAYDWFFEMLDTVHNKESKCAMNIAFHVFWNTLANNYRIYKKEKK